MKINRRMLYITFVALQLAFLANHNIYALTGDSEAEKIGQARAAFNEIVDLWYDRKFDELYDKFADREKSTISKEKFIKRMTNKKKRLACCWQKVQDVKVKLYSSGKAIVSARLGFEGPSNTVDYIAAELPVYLRDGMWLVKVKDMLAAAPDLPEYKTKKRVKIK